MADQKSGKSDLFAKIQEVDPGSVVFAVQPGRFAKSRVGGLVVGRIYCLPVDGTAGERLCRRGVDCTAEGKTDVRMERQDFARVGGRVDSVDSRLWATGMVRAPAGRSQVAGPAGGVGGCPGARVDAANDGG